MEIEIYLDNSATTKPSKKCIDEITMHLSNNYGNASSLHLKGFYSEKSIEKSRTIIANSLKCNKNEIYFTSGGTEGNNICISGIINAYKRMGNKIITTKIEHPSVLEVFKHYEELGFEVIYINHDEDENKTLEQLYNVIDINTILVSIMYVNNENGLFLPVDKISKIIKEKKSPAIFHCDAVQAYGKIQINPKKLCIDLLTISGHKIHGPQGIGAIYIKNGIKINSLMFGGGQENKVRPGTQATALIAGFGAAVEEIDYDVFNKMKEIQKYLIKELRLIENVTINTPQNSSPYIVNFSVIGIKSEVLLHYLEFRNIFVSSGSACSKGKQSYVLKAFGLERKVIDSAIRVSFSRNTTQSEIDALITQIKNAKKDIIRSK